MVHHVAVEHEAAGKVEKAGAEGHAAILRHHYRVAPIARGDGLAIDRHHLEGIGVDVKDMIVVMLVDDDPLFNRAERYALIDASRIEAAAADQIGELLIVGGGGKLRLLDR